MDLDGLPLWLPIMLAGGALVTLLLVALIYPRMVRRRLKRMARFRRRRRGA